jgi:hypothetical protein
MRGWLCVLFAVVGACNFPKAADSEDVSEAEEPSTHSIRGPDATNHWIVVRCGAAAECYQRASITCPGGWSVYDKDKSTGYQVSGTSKSTTTGAIGGGFGNLGGGVSVDTTTRGSFDGRMLPIEHGEMLVKCDSGEKEQAQVLAQLKPLCDSGNENACQAGVFADAKRGCCTWHRGARNCDDNGKVVCFDGADTSCSCDTPGLDLRAASDNKDEKLLDQLKALCGDGNTRACNAGEFAAKYQRCCAWHHGARSCSANHKVVCFDDTENTTCSCGIQP